MVKAGVSKADAEAMQKQLEAGEATVVSSMNSRRVSSRCHDGPGVSCSGTQHELICTGGSPLMHLMWCVERK